MKNIYVDYMRCPNCNGLLRIRKEEGIFTDIPLLSVPHCIECNREYEINIKSDGLLKIVIEEKDYSI